MESPKNVRAIEILLYVPNLIGYTRVLLLCAAYYYMLSDYSVFRIFGPTTYIWSFLRFLE